MKMSDQIFNPNPAHAKDAAINSMEAYWELQNKAITDYEGFWKDFADEKIDWIEPYDTVLDESDAPFYKWFTEGKEGNEGG